MSENNDNNNYYNIIIIIIIIMTIIIKINYYFKGPGGRWRHTMAAGEEYTDKNGLRLQKFALYGGHRLWHGFIIIIIIFIIIIIINFFRYSCTCIIYF